MQRRAVFLDRDGVLNEAIIKNGKPYPPLTQNEVVIPSGTLDALTKLKEAGFMLIVVTNQPDVARGTVSTSWVNTIHDQLMAELPLDDIRVCFHDDEDLCRCRKPAPGLLLKAAIDHDVNLKTSFMIGDRWKDVEAGQRAKCKTIWLNNNYDERSTRTPADFIAKTLTEAADWIIINKLN